MKIRPISTALLLVGCICLLQYHAIQFWVTHAGITGAAWSLLLEGAALWLWSSPRLLRRVLGGLVTLLLLVGPLYQVSAPLIEAGHYAANTATAGAERSRDLAGEIQSLEAALAVYLANSQTRSGWVSRIDSAQARLDRLRTEQAQLSAVRAGAPQHQPWQRTAVILMEALAIVIFQLVAVLAIGELRDGRHALRPAEAAPLCAQPPATARRAAARRANFTPAIVKPLQAVA